MRKLLSVLLVLLLAAGLACVQAESEIPDLTGDWALVYDIIDTEIVQYVYLYEDSTFEIMDDENGTTGSGTWTFDGQTLTLTIMEGDEKDDLVLAWDAETHQLTGSYEGIPVTMRLPVEAEGGDIPGGEAVEEIPTGMLAGGWTVAADAAVTDKVTELVAKALENLDGVDYVPVAYLGSQVVAGTNHAILCRAAAVVPDAIPRWVVMYVYEDLQGNVSVLNITDLVLGV